MKTSLVRKINYYWICQFIGWTGFVLLNIFSFQLQGNSKSELSVVDLITFFSFIPFGIGVTHIYRTIILQYKVLLKPLYSQIPIVIIASIVKAFVILLLQYFLSCVINFRMIDIVWMEQVSSISNYSFILFLWNSFYFAFFYIRNFRKAEIQNLKSQATLREVELNKIKSQLNPHFMFNAMNSIRALIDEDPQRAKEAVTQLSSILRNTLMLERNKTIPLVEEIRIADDYLALEKIRFEERLVYSLNCDPSLENLQVPPMFLQSLVENAIKHGISKLPEGGKVEVLIYREAGFCRVKILNSGHYDENFKTDSGFGLRNTVERLNHVFGGQAQMKMFNNHDKMVETLIQLPLIK